MTRAEPLSAAVIGLGIGEQHARTYASTPRCVLRWVYDIDREKTERVSREVGGMPGSSLPQVLADPAVDIVSIATYDDQHFEQAVSALRAGKHVFCEKPLCRTMDEVRALEAAWRASGGRRLASNLILRAAPLWRWLRDAVASGELGRVYAFDGDYLYGRLSKITDGWRKDVPDYSVLQGGGVHLVDLMQWITGERPNSVHAAGNRISTEGTAFRYQDFVAATYRFESGLIGRITANFGCVHPHQHVVRLFGTRATFVYDDRGARLHRSRDPDSAAQMIDRAPREATKGDLIPEFVASIVRGDAGEPQTHQDLDVIAACLAGDRALASGRVERVDYA